MLDKVRDRPFTALAVTNATTATLFLWLYARAKGFTLTQLATYGVIALAKSVAPGAVSAHVKVRESRVTTGVAK